MLAQKTDTEIKLSKGVFVTLWTKVKNLERTTDILCGFPLRVAPLALFPSPLNLIHYGEFLPSLSPTAPASLRRYNPFDSLPFLPIHPTFLHIIPYQTLKSLRELVRDPDHDPIRLYSEIALVLLYFPSDWTNQMQ